MSDEKVVGDWQPLFRDWRDNYRKWRKAKIVRLGEDAVYTDGRGELWVALFGDGTIALHVGLPNSPNGDENWDEIVYSGSFKIVYPRQSREPQ